MGIVWEAYHKGVPLLGVPENPIDKWRIPWGEITHPPADPITSPPWDIHPGT